jgi:hypothetical protein
VLLGVALAVANAIRPLEPEPSRADR